MSVIDNIRLTFLYIEFYSMGKTWVYPESYIPYNIFRYIVKGKAEFCIDGEEIIVKENQIVYIPQGCRMSCRALSESFEFYSLRFTTSVFYEGEDVLKEYYGIPRIIENEGEDYYFKEMQRALELMLLQQFHRSISTCQSMQSLSTGMTLVRQHQTQTL